MPDVSHLIGKTNQHNAGSNGIKITVNMTANNNKDGRLTNFEDLWDIRNNIPGEPDIDYPVYNDAPETSFECTKRHDGKSII